MKVLIIIATIVLGGIAVFTAIRLFQIGNAPVAPNVPASTPAASETQTVSCEAVAFSITLSTSSPSPTPTEPPIGGLPSPSPTISPTPTTAPTPTSSASPTMTPSLSSTSPTIPPDVPVSGVSFPSIIGVGAGIVMMFVALLIAI